MAPEAVGGVYGALAFACGVSAATALGRRRLAAARWAAPVLVGLDLATVGALVHFTGGADSMFVALYVLVVAYGALYFERRGALGAAGIAAASFGVVLVAEEVGCVRSFGPAIPGLVVATFWGVHGAALLLVAFLASFLSGELRLAGQALDRSRRDLHRLQRLHARTVESLLSGLLTTDREGRVTFMNPEAERISGGTGDEFFGQRVDGMLPGVEGLLRYGEATPARLRARMPFRNRRGELLHLGLAASVLREADGTPAGHVVIFQDLTAVVEMEAPASALRASGRRGRARSGHRPRGP